MLVSQVAPLAASLSLGERRVSAGLAGGTRVHALHRRTLLKSANDLRTPNGRSRGSALDKFSCTLGSTSHV